MRRTRLKRIKPLERKTALPASPLARSALHQNSAAQRHQPKRRTATPGIPKKVRVALASRSGGVCEIGQRGCIGRATDGSHRIKTGIGGRKGAALEAHHVLSNLLHACRVCHAQRLHAEPTQAYRFGWMLREHQDPVAEPTLYRGAWRWLANNGSVLTSDPIAAEEAA